MAHQQRPTVIGQFVGMPAKQGSNLGRDSLRHQRPHTVTQKFGQRIGKSPWLAELENVSVFTVSGRIA